jgi:simple sugar transport system permease protein
MIATGMCLVIATGGIDLSVGSMMAVAGAVAMEYLSSANAPSSIGAAAAAIGLAVGLCAVLGAVNGILISVVGLQPFITTLVMMLAGRGLAKVITGGQNTTAVNERYRWIANGYLLGLPVVFLASAAIAVAVAFVIRRSALGMMIESIGINPEASRLAGLNRRALLITVYVVSAFLAGIAGIFSTGTVMTVDVSQTGYQFELDAILAVVIGGTSLAGGRFSLAGAAIGALLIATLDKTVVFLGVPASATPAFKAAVIIVLYVAQSRRVRGWVAGLRRSRRKSVRQVVAT